MNLLSMCKIISAKISHTLHFVNENFICNRFVIDLVLTQS